MNHPQQQQTAAEPAIQEKSLLDQSLEITAKELKLNPRVPRERDILVVEREFELIQRRARMYAQSSGIPDRYKNSIADCAIAIDMADRMSVSVLEIMQNMHIVYGQPGFKASYLIARVNTSGKLRGDLQFRFTGEKGTDSYGCIAWGIDRLTGETINGTEITIGMAKAEGWYSRKAANGGPASKWPTLTDQMLQYRAGAFWQRVNAPQTSLGMTTVEEIEDAGESATPPVDLRSLRETLAATAQAAEQNELPEQDNRKVDSTTGEISEQPALIPPEEIATQHTKKTEPEKSPGYLNLHKRLMETKTAEEALKIKEYGAFKKMNATERDMLLKAINDRVNAFNSLL